uniref:Enkurin domain-containing protein n=1 Tax=Rousettus aegyptiacus TaxID=9407 RepID=A0A7J8CDA7_ROUAE|nr:hypothetical protein HJG63_000185 [Rousettus aegyptiacus]
MPRGQSWAWISLATMPALPRGPPGGILVHFRSWHRCWSSNGKLRSTTMPHRRATCPISRSHCPKPRVEGACGRWELISALGSSTLSLCIHSLLERRDLWQREAEARQHSQPDPTMPPGHTRMPENQRLETLSNLLQSQRQLLRELVLLPAGADSLRAQSHRAELDRKLVQVEEAIKIFSRPKVFVKMDA